MNTKTETIVFGGGCFWCTEAVFEELQGVILVTSGYTGGQKKNPSYEEVSAGNTGYVEVIKIEFNPEEINFRDLLTVFFATHDPTTEDQQGADIGTQYRSVIFYNSEEQKIEAENFIREIGSDFQKPIVTTIEPLVNFFEAEEYHKDYYKNNKQAPYCQVVIAPKISKLQEEFSNLLKTHKQ